MFWRILTFSILTKLTTFVHMKNLTVDCKNGCLSKCCPKNQLLLDNTSEIICVENIFISLEKYTEVEIYNKDIKQNVRRVNKTLQDFTIVHNEIFNDQYHIVLDSENIFMEPDEKLYILENGVLAVRSFNHLRQWDYVYSNDSFCVDLQVSGNASEPDPGSLKLVIRILVSLASDEDLSIRKKATMVAYAMLVSYFFLILVLLSYIVLQMRNLPSLMIMSYVVSLATAYLFRAIQILKAGQLQKNECTFVGLSLYFSMLSSFTWMNAMSNELWTSVSKPRPIRRDSHRKTLAKFYRYCIYGFGVPLLLTIFVVVIDYVDLTAVPGFVKPHFVADKGSCFFQIEKERQLYLNVPILVATVINCVFFAMSARYVYRNSAAPGGAGDSRNTKKDTNRFVIYLKLAHVMGINWVLDVACFFISTESWLLVLSDVFNSSAGVFIFLIFVCKKDMIVLLCKRFSIETDVIRQWESSTDNNVSVPKEQQTPIPLKRPERAQHQNQAKAN